VDLSIFSALANCSPCYPQPLLKNREGASHGIGLMSGAPFVVTSDTDASLSGDQHLHSATSMPSGGVHPIAQAWALVMHKRTVRSCRSALGVTIFRKSEEPIRAAPAEYVGLCLGGSPRPTPRQPAATKPRGCRRSVPVGRWIAGNACAPRYRGGAGPLTGYSPWGLGHPVRLGRTGSARARVRVSSQ
jgi:hypothetical protein